MKLPFFILFCSLPIIASAQDYTSYDKLLTKYARADGVKYQAWSENSNDKDLLGNLLVNWSAIDATQLAKNDRAAFHINHYNAAIISVVLDKYPIKSVTKIGIPFSVFKRKFISTPNGKISLDTLEKKLLLKDYRDSRIHFAVNCASISCPPLREQSYRGNKLNEQLDEQARKFMATPHAVRIDDGVVSYSSLFKWYKDDFNGDPPSTIVNKYSDQKAPASKKSKWIIYNWDLNESH